jgi:hypothetical protein
MSGNADLADSHTFDDLIFQQELNEVYLLLDFISGRPDRHLSDLDNKISDPENPEKKLSSSAIVERVSDMRYPPVPPPGKKGSDAAFLLTLKDALNSMAYPARGLTIAYTIMFSEEDHKGETNRLHAAELAFPGLSRSAASFCRVKDAMAWTGLIITILSAFLLWQVTYGVQLAARFDDAKRADTESAAKIYDQIDKARIKNVASSYDLSAVCRIQPATGTTPSAAVGEPDSTTHQLCNEFAYRHALFCVAISDVGRYSQSPLFRLYDWLLPMHRLQPADPCGPDEKQANVGRQEDAQSIATVLAMMSNYLLPILFGLVGTMAALVRGIQDKVTDSVLSPRDRALSLIRLPLGMVAGVCVGLFFNPATVAAQTNGNIGAFTVSASGIAFLAGYGAEGFFRALDTLITRIFSLDTQARPSK